jgi:competence protein ComEC
MAVFLLVTGFSASIVRAAIISSLSLAAWYYGRKLRPLLSLLIAGALTAGWYPLYIWSDIGWYLSFLAFYGVIVLAPMLQKRFAKREPKLISSIMLESFCAQLMTAPFVIYIFHQTSLVAMLSNLIIVPLVPLAMLLGLFAGLAGLLIPGLAGYIAWPASILLTYVLDIVYLFSRVPHVLVQLKLSLISMLALYGLIAALCIVLWRKTNNSGRITEIETEDLYVE